MRRVHELVKDVRSSYPEDTFFADFEASCRANPAKRKAYRTYEDAFSWLDDASWSLLKQKATHHFRDHRPGQLKQGFFNQLNEALAYRHLARQGFRRIRMLAEGRHRTPDIEYYAGRQREHCEVKTIGLSDLEIARRASREAFSNVYLQLGAPLLAKLRCVITDARAQIAERGRTGLVYVVLNFDDLALDNYASYRRELRRFANAEHITHVQLKVGVRFRRSMRL